MAISSDQVSLLFKAKGDTDEAKTAFESLAKSLGLSTSTAGQLAIGLPIAGAAIVAVAGIALGAASAIWNLTKAASDYGSKIFDASQKTGLGAQSLSALRYAAETSGSSFEKITGSVAKFNVLLGEANTGNEKAQKTLEQFNITARDTEGALNQAIQRIAQMKTADEQAAAAKALFKDRAGDVLAVIKSFDGDLPSLIAKLQKLGLVMSDEDARAADEFGDTLDTLSMQAQAIGHQFAFELMPYVTHAMESMSSAMGDNQSAARSWGQTIGQIVRGAEVYFQGLNSGVQSALGGINNAFGTNIQSASIWAVGLTNLISPLLGLFLQLGKSFPGFNSRATLGARRVELDPETNTMRTVGGDTPPPLSIPKIGGVGRGGGGSARGGGKSAAAQKAEEELNDLIRIQEIKIKRLETVYRESMERIRAEFKKTGDENVFDQQAAAEIEKFVAAVGDAREELLKLEDKLNENKSDTKQRLALMKQWDDVKKISQMIRKDREENDRTRSDSAKKAADEEKKLLDEIAKFAEETSKRIHDTVVKNANAEIKAAQDVYTETLRTRRLTAAEKIKLENDFFEVITRNTRVLRYENKVVFDNAVIDLDKWKRAKEAEINAHVKDEATRKAALEEVNAEYERRLKLLKDIYDQEEQNIQQKEATPVTKGPDYNFGFPGSWDDLVAKIQAAAPTIGETLTELGNIGVSAFQGMTQAIGGLIQNWVLMGTTGPAVLKKILAATLAALAAEAAIRAIFELAMGFASLFFNPAEAVAHFQAAALFGAVAVGAGLAGRALAGNSFRRESSGAYGSSGAGSSSGQGEKGRGGGVYSGQKDKLVETGRNQPGIMPEFIVTFKDRSNWFSDMFKIELRRNGEMREAILDAVS